MKASHQMSFFFIGLALFAMFFGSGNLIFPLYIGQLAEGQWMTATLGFLLTAVLVPIAGVIAMVVFRGDYTAFFNCLGKKMGFLVTLILLTVWIPFGSGPRCATLAYASMLPHIETPIPLWAFSIAYCGLVALMIYQKSRMLDLLGYVLTPLLLGCLALIVFKGIDFALISPHLSFQAHEIFFRSLQEGYNTMDLIASFFFSASIIDILRRSSKDESLSLSKTFKAGIVGAILLAIVYVGLISLAASHVDTLQNIPKDQLLVHIAKVVLGSHLGIVASIAVFLACLTTSVALASVFADFIADKFFQNKEKYHIALIATQLITFGMSITGLQGITFVTEPILQVFYPMLMILIVYNVGRQWLVKREMLTAENKIVEIAG